MDFETAFPAVSRLWVERVLKAAKAPQWVVNVAIATTAYSKVLRDDNSVAFAMDSGVGQGDTASASLVVIAVNPLLLAFEANFNGKPEVVSAFADDINLRLDSFRINAAHSPHP